MAELRAMVLPISMCVLASACTTGNLQDPSTAPQSAPEQNVPYSQIWSANSGIDLFSRGAELVRAALEAGTYASYYSLGTTFPGYRDAVGGPLHFDDAEILPALVPNGRGDNELGLWTDHYHIASLTETPTEIVADVCDYRQRPTEVTKSSNAQVGFPWVVHLRNTTDTPGLPGIPDTDPDTSDPRALRVPDWNVFGRWQITKLHAGGRDWKGTAPEECTNWWLQRFPGSNATDDGNVLVPAGTVVPGVPVAQQYPEWIGPSEPQ
ncbi:hypothetical protein F8M49_14245 [Rhodococcus zopfii]|uniref:Lipoprotein n=1 Tax=Rhodococcus zopfii TaxID=43772 RepID=A0ABU3WQD9_9NOCA|nr:hypothetical protein [Rhodococcus zopfii]